MAFIFKTVDESSVLSKCCHYILLTPYLDVENISLTCASISCDTIEITASRSGVESAGNDIIANRSDLNCILASFTAAVVIGLILGYVPPSHSHSNMFPSIKQAYNKCEVL